MLRLIVFLSVALLSISPTSLVAAEPSRPNIVYFLVDDLGRHDCGFMGGREIKTPHIDKLAAAGATLDAYYVQPLCSPTRAAFLTGRYPMRYGLQSGVVKPWAQYGLPLEEHTLANDLQNAGYVTGMFGKWHLGHFQPEYLPMRRGFTHHYGHYNGALDYFKHERDGGLDWHKDGKPLREEGYATDLLGQHAAEFVEKYAGKKPFFLYLPFNAVHSPYQPPKGGAAQYPELKGVRQSYAAMLTSVDDAIGRVVAAVDKAGVRDNTLFIFSSDNGGPSPGRITSNGEFRGGKGGLYEGGVRVAAFATWPGHIAAGSTIEEPMHIVDWRPTLQKLCGAPTSSELPMDGKDISPTLTEKAPSPHDFILLNTTPQSAAIRAGDWKLITKRAAAGKKQRAAKRGRNEVELYNLNDDPHETTNLAAENPEKVAELRAVLTPLRRQAAPTKNRPMPENFKAPPVWGEAG